MDFFDSATLWQIQNLAYLLILLAVWTTILAVIMPGTGALEAFAGVCLFLSAIAALTLPINFWALPLLLLGFLAFVLELWKPAKGVFLLFSILLFIAGSIFLFRDPQGGLAGVSWWIAVTGSLLTAVFFWFAFHSYIRGNRGRKDYSADQVIGKVGETRTEVFRQGSVQVASALWSAQSESRIPVGTKVRVISRDGLTLTVRKEE